MKSVVRLLAGLAAVGAVWTALPAAAQTFPVQMQRHQSSYFKGVGPVVVPTYHLTFVTSQEATAVGGMLARVRMNKVLSGVDEAAMRRLADEAHADLKAQLTAAGYAVASDEQARAMVAANAVPLQPGNVDVVQPGGGIGGAKNVRRGHVMVAPTAAPALAPYKAGANYLGQIPINNRIAKGQPKDTLVVIPQLLLDFAQMEMSTGSRFSRDQSANVGGSAVFSIRGNQSPVTVVKVMDRDRMFPATIVPAADYGVPTAFATEEAGGASVRPSFFIGAETRGDAVVVNLPVWEGLVRQAFKDYNAAIVASLVKGRG